MTRVLCLLSGALCAYAVAVTPALAAEAEQGTYDGDVQELVVTARKREENIRDVPDTIQAFSAVSLERAGVESVGDLTQLVPGFRVVEAQQPGVVLINIRGVGQVRNGESPIAVVIDGVQQNSPNQITQDLVDIEQIEVLKGPQGSLYGRNAVGGAINITTKAPSDTFGGSAEMGYAQGSEYSAKGTISGPIGDVAGFRLGASYLDRGGQIYNSTVDRNVDFNKIWTIRGSLIVKPASNLKIDLRGNYSNQEAGASWYHPGGPNTKRYPVIGNLLGQAERILTDISGKVDLDLGAATLTSITAYSKVKSDLFEELDWEPLDLLAVTQALDVKAWSQEVRLASNGSGRLRWLLGAYYLNTERTLATNLFLQPDLTGLPDPLLSSAQKTVDNNDAYAAFGQLTYQIVPSLEFTAGLRYDIDRRRTEDLAPPTPATPSLFKGSYKALQPKFSLAYKFDGGTLVYATAARGFRSGGFNANDIVTREYGQETLWSYELGFKTALADRAVYVNGAVFYMDVKNRQVAGLDLSTGPAQFIANPIPKSSIWGAELEVTARPVEGLDLSLGGSLLNSKIDKYDLTLFAGTAANGDFTGNKLNQMPKVSINASGQYTAKVGPGKLVTRVDATYWGGDYYWEIDNQDKQDPVFLVNARLIYQIDNYELSVFARNLFDRRYDVEFVPVEFGGTLTGEDLGSASPPRQIGVSAKIRF